MTRRSNLRVTTLLVAMTVATIVVAPMVSVCAAMLVAVRRVDRRFAVAPWVWALAIATIVAVLSVPSSRLPFGPNASARAAKLNLLSADGIVNVEATASWRLSDGTFVGDPSPVIAVGAPEAKQGPATCVSLAEDGRMFQVAPVPDGMEALIAVADVTLMTSPATASSLSIELRIAAHGGSGSGTTFQSPVPETITHTHILGPSSYPERAVVSIWNRSNAVVSLCVRNAALLHGVDASRPESPIVLAAMNPTGVAIGRLASSAHVALALLVVGIGIVGWRNSWRHSARVVEVGLIMNLIAVSIAMVIARLVPLPWLMEALPHKNFVATLVAVMLLVLLPSLRSTIWRLVLAMLTGAALVAMDARAVAVGLGASAAVLLLQRLRFSFGRAIAAAAGVLAVATVAVVLTQGSIGVLEADDGARSRLFRVTWDAIADRPWTGYGFGRSADVLRVMMRDDPIVFGHAHNVFLDLGLQGGVVVAATALVIMVGLTVLAYRRSETLGAASLVLLASSSTDVTLLVPSGVVAISLIAGSLLSRLGSAHAGARDRATRTPQVIDASSTRESRRCA